MDIQPVLVVHGGAGNLDSQEDRRQYLAGVEAALQVGLAVLEQGAAAAVRAAVRHMEAHTIMNAGRGAALAVDGTVALDAGFMDGTTRRYGGVTGVRNCVHPVELAARLAEEGDFGRFLAPPCVHDLPAHYGLEICQPSDLITERARAIWHRRLGASSAPARTNYLDTVGAVARDARGHVAAAVSTGGMSLKRPGRIGDSPVVGAGYWADDRAGAAVSTGVGEALLRAGTARRSVQLLTAASSPVEAAAQALDELVEHAGDERGLSGLILVSATGEVAVDHNSREMSAAWGRPGTSPVVGHLWRAR